MTNIQAISDRMYIQALEKALARVIAANAGLSVTKKGVTLYEAAPSKDDDALAAWKELNDAIAAAKTILEDDPQAGAEP